MLTCGILQFTAIENESLWNRMVWQFRRGFAWLRGEMLAPFSVHQRDPDLSDLGYLLLEFIHPGKPLSTYWKVNRHDETRRANLYHGLSRVLLDLAKINLPRIGSWTMNEHGIVSLTNRPLLDLTMLWNRHNIPTHVARVCSVVF
jgi:hypothetical protein